MKGKIEEQGNPKRYIYINSYITTNFCRHTHARALKIGKLE